jgi:putative transposase
LFDDKIEHIIPKKGGSPMPNKDYNAFLEKSVLDLLQYDKKACVEQVLRTTFEAILRAEQKGFLGYGIGDKPVENNKRNGYRQSSLIKGLTNMFRINIPRDRLGLFKPVFLELLRDQTDRMNDLAFNLYVKGLSTQEISDVVFDMYGKSISRTTISNITDEVLIELDAWRNKPLQSQYYAVYIDALRVPLRRDTVEKEAFYIALGLRADLKREVLGIYHLPEESLDGWNDVIKGLKDRGLSEVLLFVTDEFTQIEQAILRHYPETDIQRCIVHKKRNILKKVRNKDKREIMDDFNHVLDIDNPKNTIPKAVVGLNRFIVKWGKIYPSIKNMFERKKEYFSYLKYPFAMRRMVYTNNWIENLNRQVKRTTKIRGAFPNEKSAEKLITLKCMEKEDHYMKYPITSLLVVQDQLDDMMNCRYKKPVFQTHKT